MNKEWWELSGDDLDIGTNRMGFRRAQWEETRSKKMRSEAICKAEKLGEEVVIEIKGTERNGPEMGTRKGTGKRCERWRSPAEESDESLQEKVGRLAKRVEELENDRKKGRDSRAVTGSSSENEEVSGKWKWDGENWWFRVDHRRPINSRLRRKISRAAKTTIDETKKWGDELFQLGSRVEWLETEKQRAQQTKHGSVTLPESKHQGRPAGNQECPRAANWEFSCDSVGGRPPWGVFTAKCFLKTSHTRAVRHARQARGFVVLTWTSFNLVRTVFMSPPAGRWRRLAPWAP